jgi:hypothetical protein
MGESTHTIRMEGDTADLEEKLKRLVALAERFNELWGDAPMPDGIERFTIAEGDRVVFRYDRSMSKAEVAQVRAQIKAVMPEIMPVVLSGGLRLEGVLAPE